MWRINMTFGNVQHEVGKSACTHPQNWIEFSWLSVMKSGIAGGRSFAAFGNWDGFYEKKTLSKSPIPLPWYWSLPSHSENNSKTFISREPPGKSAALAPRLPTTRAEGALHISQGTGRVGTADTGRGGDGRAALSGFILRTFNSSASTATRRRSRRAARLRFGRMRGEPSACAVAAAGIGCRM